MAAGNGSDASYDVGAPYDVIVVGAGIGGLYGVKTFRDRGLRVLGIEAAPDVGGVWFHNRYPGARVDVESIYYCYYFDPELYREWTWSEIYAPQPELLAYLQHVANRYDLYPSFLFNTRVVGARWLPEERRWQVRTEPGRTLTTRHLVMATGQLSKARPPAFPGLDGFEGEWTQTSQWEPVRIDGVRVAVIGTGSSGVQATTAISKRAAHTYVLQRTPPYILPAHNGPFDARAHARIAADVPGSFQALRRCGGLPLPAPAGSAHDFTPEERERILEERWVAHSFGVMAAFTDIATDAAANQVVADFVRRKMRERIMDPAVADKLIQNGYPIGARRIVIDTGYLECFNRPDVTLVDVAEDPIGRIVANGIELRSGRLVEVDTIVFALGFEAFTGAIAQIDVRNEHGAGPFDHWTRGPQTYLGVMTRGFPNFFIVNGPGSPATRAPNLCLTTVHNLDFICGLIATAMERGAARVEPGEQAVAEWTAHTIDVGAPLLQRLDDNYMVHVNEDGSRVMIPFSGSIPDYLARCEEVAAAGYPGFEFSG